MNCSVLVKFDDNTKAYFNSEIPLAVGNAVIAGGKTGVVTQVLEWLDIQDFPLVECKTTLPKKTLPEETVDLGESVVDYAFVQQTADSVLADRDLPMEEEINAPPEEFVCNPDDFIIRGGVLMKYKGKDGRIRIPDGVEEIGGGISWKAWDHAVRAVVIPKSVYRIGEKAFYSSSLEEVIFEGVPEEIAEEAFDSDDFCVIRLPQGVKTIGEFAFLQGTLVLVKEKKRRAGWNVNCFSLAGDVIFDSTNYIEENGILYGAAIEEGKPFVPVEKAEKLCVIGATKHKSKIVIPDMAAGKPVVLIAAEAFKNAKWLEEIVLPRNLDTIGEGAFKNSELQRVVFPEEEFLILSEAFYGTYLQELFLPANARFEEGTEGQFACSLVTDLIVEEGADNRLPPRAFEDCAALKNVVLPESIAEIGDGAFHSCINLEHVCIGGTPELGEDVFLGDENLRCNKRNGKYFLGNPKNPFAVHVKIR